MKSTPVLYWEGYKPPRLLTWPLVFVAAGAIAWAGDRGPVVVMLCVSGVLCALLLLEFTGVAVEVTEAEVRFCILPFYERIILISDIQHWEVRTYESLAPVWSRYSWRPPRHCVELIMKDGSRFSITSAHPEPLLHAIAKVKGMSAGHEIHSAGHHHITHG